MIKEYQIQQWGCFKTNQVAGGGAQFAEHFRRNTYTPKILPCNFSRNEINTEVSYR